MASFWESSANFVSDAFTTYGKVDSAKTSYELNKLTQQTEVAKARAELAKAQSPAPAVSVAPARAPATAPESSRFTILPQTQEGRNNLGFGTVLLLGLLLIGSRF